MSKQRGLYKKFEVKKIENPTKVVDAMVMEFDDPIARIGIRHYALAALDAGYDKLHEDIMKKLGEWKNL